MLFSLISIFSSVALIPTLVLQCGGKESPPSRGDSKKGKDDPPKRQTEIAPKKMPLNEKEGLIKQGLQTGKHAYPTLEDIPSDWSDKDGKKEKDKKQKNDKAKKTKEDKTIQASKDDKKDEKKEEKKEEKKDSDKKSEKKEEEKKDDDDKKSEKDSKMEEKPETSKK